MTSGQLSDSQALLLSSFAGSLTFFHINTKKRTVCYFSININSHPCNGFAMLRRIINWQIYYYYWRHVP